MFAASDIYGRASAMAEVGIAVYPDAQLSAILGLTDLFAVATWAVTQHSLGTGAIRVTHWAADGSGRIACTFDSIPGTPPDPAFILAPSCLGHPPSAEATRQFAGWLRDRHAGGAVVASFCLGAFLLAEAGLLRGRKATTHWRFGHELAERFPDIDLRLDRLIVDEGDIITAGGLLAWVDLGLLIVGRILGGTIAVESARYLLVDASGREQRHYSAFLPRLRHGDAAVLAVQHWLQAQTSVPVTTEAMAGRAGLSPRTFLRRFRKATGLTPTAYTQRLRIDRARGLLEASTRPVKAIAWDVGYSDVAAFTRLFNRIVGLSPSDYRRRFAASDGRAGVPAPPL